MLEHRPRREEWRAREESPSLAPDVPIDQDEAALAGASVTDDVDASHARIAARRAETRAVKARVKEELRERYLTPEHPGYDVPLEDVLGGLALASEVSLQELAEEMGITRDRRGKWRLQLPGTEGIPSSWEDPEVIKALAIGFRDARNPQELHDAIVSVYRYFGEEPPTLPQSLEDAPTVAPVPMRSGDEPPATHSPGAAARERTVAAVDAPSSPELPSSDRPQRAEREPTVLAWMREQRWLRWLVPIALVGILKGDHDRSADAHTVAAQPGTEQLERTAPHFQAFRYVEAKPAMRILQKGETLTTIARELLARSGITAPTETQVVTITKVLTDDNAVGVEEWGTGDRSLEDRVLLPGFEVQIGGAQRTIASLRRTE